MAKLYATYCRAFPNVYAGQAGPIAVGEGCRTEEIEIGASAANGTLTAGEGDIAVVLLAAADCWVAVGETPNVVAAGGSRAAWPVPAGMPFPLMVKAGQRVAVIQR